MRIWSGPQAPPAIRELISIHDRHICQKNDVSAYSSATIVENVPKTTTIHACRFRQNLSIFIWMVATDANVSPILKKMDRFSRK